MIILDSVPAIYEKLYSSNVVASQAEFAERLGWSAAYVSQIMTGVRGAPKGFNDRLKHAFPDQRIELAKTVNKASNANLVKPVKAIKSAINKVVETANIYINQYGVRFERLADKSWRMFNKRVPFAAHAAYMAGWGDPEYIGQLPEHTMIVAQPTEDNYITFPVFGDCQDDNTRYGLVQGEAITGQSLSRSMWQYTLPFKSPDAEPMKVTKGKEEIELDDKSPRHTYWILISPKLGLRIAMIKRHDTATGILYCTCRNPDKKLHPDFEVQIDECNQIFFGISVERTL